MESHDPPSAPSESVRFLPAREADEETVLDLMREFYLVERLPYDRERLRRALRASWRDPALARVYLLEAEGGVQGHAVLAFGFSFEFDGRDALIDELYIREEARERGLGTRFIGWLEEVCLSEGITALHLEVDRVNTRGQRLYRRLGFYDHERYLMTKRLGGGG